MAATADYSGTPLAIVSFQTERRHLERRIPKPLEVLDVDGGGRGDR